MHTNNTSLHVLNLYRPSKQVRLNILTHSSKSALLKCHHRMLEHVIGRINLSRTAALNQNTENVSHNIIIAPSYLILKIRIK